MIRLSNKASNYYLFLVLFLGMLSAFGPFVTDMYLPTLPSMVESFGTTSSMVQLGLTMAFLGLAIGQVFLGPLSDRIGRRPVLWLSLILFAVSALACVFSPNVEFFLGCRLLQGIGGAGGIVLSRSIATDCCTGRELARMMAITGGINGIAPVLAPVVGGIIGQITGWQGIFVALLAWGVVLMLMIVPFRETLLPEKRSTEPIQKIFNGYAELIRIRAFRLPTLVYGLAHGVLFGYIASSPFLIQNHFGFSEMGFSVVFGINAVGIALGVSLSLKFRSPSRALTTGASMVAALTVLQMLSALFFDLFMVYELLTVMILFSLGLQFSSSVTLAMDAGRKHIGTASAFMGALGFMVGGIASPIVGIGDIRLVSAVVLLVCALANLPIALAVGREHRPWI